MKKIRSAEYLVAIAIVTSAGVLQIREHMQPLEAPAASAQAASSCGITRDGLVPAACEPTRSERQVERAPQLQHSAARIWV
ncbi:hypothetical protein PQR53_32520 [Paraburkholderia fungorum]|jgi:hypothetical protein|uniref:hypothetical protein n=1 Tax=Paraburkholderia fungorum TaxID=134537 RepID=UPI0038BB4AA1